MRAKCSDVDFIRMFEELGASETAKRLGNSLRSVTSRRRRLEKTHSRTIQSPHPRGEIYAATQHPGRLELQLKNGIALVGSDAHYWPGKPSTAHRAFVKFCKELKPQLVIMNGDVIDGATVSRHPPIGWESRPALQQEIETAAERLHEIVLASPRNARTIWTLGNHDARLETRIATMLPELAQMKGVHLKDHFDERWEPCWSAFINDDVVIKHRFRGGIHAAHNNVMWAGRTMIAGHTHSLKVNPFDDYNGTRWGVDTGMLASVNGRQFQYAEDNPKNWRSGFVVLTFKDGKLLWPEIVAVAGDNHVDFRGGLHRV